MNQRPIIPRLALLAFVVIGVWRARAGTSNVVVFLETMATNAVKPWPGTGCDNAWTVFFNTSNPFEQNRNATFQLHKGGALYSGFAGNETQRDQRDWEKDKTILNGNGAYHVVTGADAAVLDGFTITGGSAPSGGGGGPGIHVTPQVVMSGVSTSSGSGMVNYHASPVVRNCIFENNQAGKGGAVYSMTSTSFPPRPDASSKAPVFINGLFTGNQAQSAGGMGNDGGSSPVLYFCTFTKNHAVVKATPAAKVVRNVRPANNLRQ